MNDLLKKLDGYKSYAIGIFMVLAGAALWVLAMLKVEGVPSIDVATELFFGGLTLLGLRSAARKVIDKQTETTTAVDRLTRMSNGPRQD